MTESRLSMMQRKVMGGLFKSLMNEIITLLFQKWKYYHCYPQNIVIVVLNIISFIITSHQEFKTATNGGLPSLSPRL